MCLEAEQRTTAALLHISRDWVRVLLPRSGREGEVHTPRERLEYPGWISPFNMFPFLSSMSADLNISSGMNVCVGSRRMHAHRLRLCNSITLHLPWCVAHAVQTQTNFSPSQTPARRWISFSRFKQSLHTPEAHTSEPKPVAQPCMTLTHSNLRLWNGVAFCAFVSLAVKL